MDKAASGDERARERIEQVRDAGTSQHHRKQRRGIGDDDRGRQLGRAGIAGHGVAVGGQAIAVTTRLWGERSAARTGVPCHAR